MFFRSDKCSFKRNKIMDFHITLGNIMKNLICQKFLSYGAKNNYETDLVFCMIVLPPYRYSVQLSIICNRDAEGFK